MGAPAKPTGDVVRPLTAQVRQIPTMAKSAPMRWSIPPTPVSATPRSSAIIPSLAPGQSYERPSPTIQACAKDLGKPMDRTLQSNFGARLHADFSAVRVHTGEQAAKSTEAIHARAFTVGNDIVFGAAQYQPDSSVGQHLIAHELAHVVQPEASVTRAISIPGETCEREADQAADAVMQGRSLQPQATRSASIQREPKDGGSNATRPVLERMLDKASPFLAASTGSASLDNFYTGKSDLKPAHLKTLGTTAASITTLLRQYPQSTITIIGHTDTVGTEANNLTLGQARAGATAKVLEDLGVPEDLIRIRSEGERSPLAVPSENETSEAGNRRVEVRFEPNAVVNPTHAPTLKPQTRQKLPDIFLPAPLPDLNYHPPVKPTCQGSPYRHGRSWDDTYGKKIAPAKAGPSVLDFIGLKVIDPVVDKVASWLPYKAREIIKAGARDGLASGVAKLARSAAQSQGVKDSAALDAIEKATEAAIKEEGTHGADSSP